MFLKTTAGWEQRAVRACETKPPSHLPPWGVQKRRRRNSNPVHKGSGRQKIWPVIRFRVLVSLRLMTRRSALVVIAAAMSPKPAKAAYVVAAPCGEKGRNRPACIDGLSPQQRGRGRATTPCISVCPVDCIGPHDADPFFKKTRMVYIDPVQCIDCGACVPVCPVSAIFASDDLPEKWEKWQGINARYYQR